MYTRQLDGKELNFGVSGMLYKDALVMFDRETRSLWTQVDGSVLRGELSGSKLEQVPAVQTTWREWKRLHPDTLVLKQDRRISRSNYARYFQDPNQYGITGEQKPDKRLKGKDMVVSLRDGVDALAVPVDKLKKNPFFETTLGDTPIVVVWNPGSETARVFDRRRNGEALDFYVVSQGRELEIKDKQSGSVWNGMTGAAVKGEAAGEQLTPIPYMVNFWWAWAAYNPHTRVEP